VTHLAALLVIAVVLFLRYRQVEKHQRISPDCRYYLQMVRGDGAPKPYNRRVLVPWVSRTLDRLLYTPRDIMLRRVVLVGTVLCPFVVYAVTLKLNGTAFVALVAALVFIGTESLTGCWLLLPMLVDSWALAFAGLAFLAPDPISCAAVLLLAAMTKEIGWALGSAFVIALTPMWWWVAVPGAVALILLARTQPSRPADRPSLERPIRHALDQKRAVWFDYGRSLSGMKATPWMAAAVLPGSAIYLPALLVVGIAAAQCFVAVDHGRLIAMCGVFLIPVVAVAAPEWVLGPWALASLLWPFKAEWI
jgi:hypothetical protein